MMPAELSGSSYIVGVLLRSQGVFAGGLDIADFHVENPLLVIHGQYQGLAVGGHGAVPYQKGPVLL